jgi:hypothetical protein
MPLRVCGQVSFDWLLAFHFVRRISQHPSFTSDMKRISILSMVISFAMICSCQKQDVVAEQQLAQRKVELDAREEALDERLNAFDAKLNALDTKVKALAENEKSRANVQTIPPAAQSQDVIRDPAEAEAERDRVMQQFRALIPDHSQMNAAKVEKDRMTRERLQRQGAQQQSQSQKQYKFQQIQKAWMSGAAVSPAAPTTSSVLDAASPTPSPPVDAGSPTASPAAESTLPTPSPTPE